MNIAQLLQNPVLMNEVVLTLRSNPSLAIQLFQQAAPALFNDLDRLRAILYKTLTGEQQTFLSTNLPDLPNFLESPEGKKQITEFVDTWMISK